MKTPKKGEFKVMVYEDKGRINLQVIDHEWYRGYYIFSKNKKINNITEEELADAVREAKTDIGQQKHLKTPEAKLEKVAYKLANPRK